MNPNVNGMYQLIRLIKRLVCWIHYEKGSWFTTYVLVNVLIFTKVRQFYLEHIIGYQLKTDNQSLITVSIFGQRSFSKMFSTTYLPTLCLLVLVQMTFYFPEENFQVRAMVSQGYNHIFLLNQKFKVRRMQSSSIFTPKLSL